MFVINDVLYLYGGYCKIFPKGEKAKGVVHSGMGGLPTRFHRRCGGPDLGDCGVAATFIQISGRSSWARI